MSDPERLHRPEPERTAPVRNWTNLYRFDPWNERAPSDGLGAGPDGSAAGTRQDDWVTQGVKLAYQVIDEFIRRGQSAAQQMGARSYGAAQGSGGNQAQDVVARMLRCSAEMVPLWFEFMNSMSANFLRASQAPFQAQAPRPAGEAAQGAGVTSVSVEISSVRLARVSVEMHARPGDGSLMISALRAMDPRKPPLTDIEFLPATGGGEPTLRIRIPETQPADIYTGVFVDKNSGEARGTLTVRISE